MDIDICSKNENKLLGRTEVEFKVKGSKATPSRKDLRGKLAALLNSKEQQVVVDSVKQEFGSGEIAGTARIYNEEEKLKMLDENIRRRRPGGESRVTLAKMSHFIRMQIFRD